MAPNAYIVGATLAPEQAVAHHRTAIISMFWPGSVLSDRTALTGGMPSRGGSSSPIRTQLAAPTWNCPGSQCHSVSARVRCRAICRCQTDSIFRVRPGGSSRTSASPDDLPAGVRVAKQAPNWSETRSTRWPAKVVPVPSHNILSSQLDAISNHLPGGPRRGGPEPPRRCVLRVFQRIEAHVRAPGCTIVRRAVRRASSVDVPRPRRTARRHGARARPALGSPQRWTWEPFFEAYFSNFIEGTEFGVEEAREIAIDGVIPSERPADAHDVVATYRIVSDPVSRAVAPASADELLDELRDLHRILFAARPEERPGGSSRSGGTTPRAMRSSSLNSPLALCDGVSMSSARSPTRCNERWP